MTKMIKKAMSLFLALVLLLCVVLTSCYRKEENEIETDNESLSETEVSATDEGYKSIVCRDSKSSDAYMFSLGDDSLVLKILMPKEWTISKVSGGYDILRDGDKIGTLKKGRVALGEGETSLEKGTNSCDGAYSEWNLISSGGEYRHRIVYSYVLNGTERAITLEVGYAELGEYPLRKAKYNISLQRTVTDSQSGTIKLTAKAGEKPILILGNSFVGTSQVGSIFEQMCNAGAAKNNYEVIGVSQGMATVSKNWSEYKNGMRNGEYAAVFMCGFYGSGDVSAFQTFVDLCKASNTPIVIFPAHNEGNGGAAAKRYPDVYYLDWKGELDAIIRSGVSKWDLCVDDEYDHSTHLAGYVGAHMIYRALFGEMPPVLNTYYDVQHTTVVEKLGEDYVQTGSLEIISDQLIYEIK